MTTTATSYTDVTARQLRQVLTEVADQDMTVRQLRAWLFEIDAQDAPVHNVLWKIDLASDEPKSVRARAALGIVKDQS